MKAHITKLPGLAIIETASFLDERGSFGEIYNAKTFASLGIPGVFVQYNHSRSRRHVLRGLHYQLPHAQAKLVYVVYGSIWDVAVDLRVGSPTFRQWMGLELSEENRKMLFLPEGFAHGFCVTSDRADVMYACTDFYSPPDERGVRWDDPEIGITWPCDSPIVSKKDLSLPFLRDITEHSLPR
jgi:dTDP-4-dehydrorhamnose 3,5-epimerase